MSNFDDIIDANLQDIYKICFDLVHEQKLARKLTHEAFFKIYDYYENVKEDMMFAELVNIVWESSKNYNTQNDEK